MRIKCNNNVSVSNESISRFSDRNRLNNLVVAVLDVSFKDLKRSIVCTHDRVGIKELAMDWFENTTNEPFTFLWCCEVLQLDSKQFLEQCRKHYN